MTHESEFICLELFRYVQALLTSEKPSVSVATRGDNVVSLSPTKPCSLAWCGYERVVVVGMKQPYC